ncbi:unnamed protein product [Clonostachys byssicola]|uniref:Nitroreductase domain-containing protein n=1 Tax=Clonostachys byssicola TaxID=160290 RepID=A0A9N9URP8_9HYPO|nr:unnamed protein product [Clonostachys byssicola]
MASKGGADKLLHLVRLRRTYYALNKRLTIPRPRVEHIVKESLLHVPSSFNSQSTRVVVLFGTDHEKLWDIVTDVLKKKVAEAKWEPTSRKMAMFKRAAGTIMFFEDQTIVNESVARFPSYAQHFGTWATQSDAMLQYTIWLGLEAEGLGANLQHYNPIIDDRVADEWKIPVNWRLNAQMVFGGYEDTPTENSLMPLEERYRVFQGDAD